MLCQHPPPTPPTISPNTTNNIPLTLPALSLYTSNALPLHFPLCDCFWAGTVCWIMFYGRTLGGNTGATSTDSRLCCLAISRIVTGLELNTGRILDCDTGATSTDSRLHCLKITRTSSISKGYGEHSTNRKRASGLELNTGKIWKMTRISTISKGYGKTINKDETSISWGCRRLEAETVSSVFFPDDYVFEHFDPP